MSIVTGQLSVGTATPTAVNLPDVNPLRVHIHNNDNTNHLVIGGSAVTANTGLILLKLDSIELIVAPNDVLYLLSSSGTITASYLVQKL